MEDGKPLASSTRWLTKKEQAFVRAYFDAVSPTKGDVDALAEAAGYHPLRDSAWWLMRRPKIVARMESLRGIGSRPPARLQWLWPARIPLGKVTLIFGDPSLGKSLVTLDIAARVSRGMPWPDAPGERTTPGGVLILTAEDDMADTVRPRLDAAGADVTRIVALQAVKRADGGRAYFNLADDLLALEDAIRRTPDARVVIFDPITAYCSGTDTHKCAEVRAALAPLSDLAARYGVAILAITQMNKATGGRALYRAMGSLAFVAAAQFGWLVVADDQNPKRRLFLAAKSNLSKEPSGLAYSVQAMTLDGLGPVPRVVWEDGPVSQTADAALAAARARRRRNRTPKKKFRK